MEVIFVKNTNTDVKLAIPYGYNEYGKDKTDGQGGGRTARVALGTVADTKLLLQQYFHQFPSNVVCFLAD